MTNNKYVAGVGRALLFSNDELIAVAKTLTESTFNFSITSEEIRGGQGNALFGKYFHDSNLGITLTDAMFSLENLAANLGVDVEQGGLCLYESSKNGEAVVTAGSITLTHTPVAFSGSIIGWYKKPADQYWSIATISGNVMSIPEATVGEVYCVKYFYQNMNARQITIKTQYVPKVLHLVIINDLFSGDPNEGATVNKYGRLITDIPAFQLDGKVLSLVA